MTGWSHTKKDTELDEFMPNVRKNALLPGEYDFEKEERDKKRKEERSLKEEREVRKYITELGPEMACGRSGKAFRAWRSLPSFPRKATQNREPNWQEPRVPLPNRRIPIPMDAQKQQASWMTSASEPASWLSPSKSTSEPVSWISPTKRRSPTPDSPLSTPSQKRFHPEPSPFQQPPPFKQSHRPEPSRVREKSQVEANIYHTNSDFSGSIGEYHVGPALKPTPKYKKIPPPKELNPQAWHPVHRKRNRRRRSRSRSPQRRYNTRDHARRY